MNPSIGRSRHRRFAPWRALAAALLSLPFAPSACALDVTDRTAVPAPIPDGVIEIGGRRLHLPPGNWMLTGWSEHTTSGYARGGDTWGRGVSAWATLVENGHLRAIVWLALPVQDFKAVTGNGEGCRSQEGTIERMNLSRQLSKPECLAVYVDHDAQAILERRSPYTLRWLVKQKLGETGPLVRFVYGLRSEWSYGAMNLVLPTGPFDSDDDARRWALGLRDATRAFLEHRTSEATLPALPSLESSGNAMAR
jgi:hypothetical protein